MAKTVQEIMNRELFSLRPDEGCEDALGFILALGISGAPVVDGAGKPIGVVSFRDLLRHAGGDDVASRMTSPALTVSEGAAIEAAARLVGERGVHRIVVVDDTGRAVGIVSSVDLVRGLLGMPPSHPTTFPHYDAVIGASWTDETELVLDQVDVAPDAAGVFVLVRGGAGITDRVVWTEGANNVRTRLYDILSLPQSDPALRRVLETYGALRFRAAAIPDREALRHAARALRDTEAARSPLA
jgi:CBS domain-containing protein